MNSLGEYLASMFDVIHLVQCNTNLPCQFNCETLLLVCSCDGDV